VNPLDFPLIADENIHPDVVAGLRAQGRDITSCRELGLVGEPDPEVLRRAFAVGRVVLTHDADFGQLAVSGGQPYVGIIHVRPGHIVPTFTIETFSVLAATHIDVTVPFILVAERRGGLVRVRVRQAVEDEPA
jgi:predicted nuclease of predicted toxin-antitoxin system